jgi:predicted MPP superfamily phosphohydrolase
MLQQEPRIMPETLSAGIDLQLSGHTHYGQMWPWNFFSYLVYGKYHYGLHHKKNLTIYTSNGTGSWGPPMRLWQRSEIVKITFK